MHLKRIVLALALAALTAGCADRAQIDRAAAIPPYPDVYRAALQKEFLLLANRETGKFDFADADRFRKRAEEAARAVRVTPHALDAYEVAPAERPDLAKARAQLMTLFDGGLARAPETLARAHAAYECWLEEAEEGHQRQDIDWCRDRFYGAVGATRQNSGLDADWGVVLPGEDGEVGAITLGGAAGDDQRLLDSANAGAFVNEGQTARGARMTRRETQKFASRTMALLPPPAKLYVVYFPSGSDRLGDAAKATIAKAAADAAARDAVDIEVIGFADRTGEDRRNIALSQRRADAVVKAMQAAGAEEDAFLVYARGEDHPAVDTPDGAAEVRNRRVEITVR